MMSNETMRILRGCTLIALGIGMGSLAARADNVYSSQAAWAAALAGSPTTINFEGIAPDLGNVYVGGGPGANTTVGGVNFAIGPAGGDNLMFINGDGSQSYLTSSVSVGSTSLTGSPSDLLVTLPSSVTALGFDFSSYGAADTATITLSDGLVQTVLLSDSGLQFFGVTAPGGVTSVDISMAPGTYANIMTDFSYGSVTPEPGTILLLGTGLAGLAGLVRRKFGRHAA